MDSHFRGNDTRGGHDGKSNALVIKWSTNGPYQVAELLDLKPEQVLAVGKYKKTVAARSLLCFWIKLFDIKKKMIFIYNQRFRKKSQKVQFAHTCHSLERRNPAISDSYRL